MKLNLGGGMA